MASYASMERRMINHQPTLGCKIGHDRERGERGYT